jgi:hypothetical protein
MKKKKEREREKKNEKWRKLNCRGKSNQISLQTNDFLPSFLLGRVSEQGNRVWEDTDIVTVDSVTISIDYDHVGSANCA